MFWVCRQRPQQLKDVLPADIFQKRFGWPRPTDGNEVITAHNMKILAAMTHTVELIWTQRHAHSGKKYVARGFKFHKFAKNKKGRKKKEAQHWHGDVRSRMNSTGRVNPATKVPERSGTKVLCGRTYSISTRLFFPPVRWGLLDFMSVSSSPSPPSPPPLCPLLLRRSPQLTGILCVQCGVLDRNGNWDPLSSVWRAGPQLQLAFSQFSVACWTPTAILWVRCGVLDPNRDIASSVWRAGPQPRYCVYCEFSVACWTPTAILRVECGVLDPRKSGQRSSCKMSQDKSDRVSADMFARRSERMWQREWSKICQECQKRMFG